MAMDIQLFYEHARRFSFKIRGMQLFDQLGEFCMTHKWFRGNRYLVELDPESKSFIKFSQQKSDAKFDVHYTGAAKAKANKYIDDSEESEVEEPVALNFKITGDSSYVKLPVIQEIKIICLHFGAIVQDVLQENHQHHKRYIHVLKFPY